MLQRKQPYRTSRMITLLLAVVAAGAANVALVAFMADRLGPQAGVSASAGEFVAIAQSAPAAGKRGAVKVGNANASTYAAKIAA